MGLRSQRNILSPLCPLSHTLFFSLSVVRFSSPLYVHSLSLPLLLSLPFSRSVMTHPLSVNLSLCVSVSQTAFGKAVRKLAHVILLRANTVEISLPFSNRLLNRVVGLQLLLCCASLKKGTVSLQKPVEMWRQSNLQFPMLVGVTMAH